MTKNKKLARLLVAAVATATVATSIPVHAAFDAKFYAANNPDVVAVVGQSPKALEKHYNTFGVKEGRAASAEDSYQSVLRSLFDAELYASKYPDVVAVYGNDANALFAHFITFGIHEGRAINPYFDVQAYKKAYPDLAAVFGDNIAAYYLHFANFGVKEHRTLGGYPAEKILPGGVATQVAAISGGSTGGSSASGSTSSGTSTPSGSTTPATPSTPSEDVASKIEEAGSAAESAAGKAASATTTVNEVMGAIDELSTTGSVKTANDSLATANEKQEEAKQARQAADEAQNAVTSAKEDQLNAAKTAVAAYNEENGKDLEVPENYEAYVGIEDQEFLAWLDAETADSEDEAGTKNGDAVAAATQNVNEKEEAYTTANNSAIEAETAATTAANQAVEDATSALTEVAAQIQAAQAAYSQASAAKTEAANALVKAQGALTAAQDYKATTEQELENATDALATAVQAVNDATDAIHNAQSVLNTLNAQKNPDDGKYYLTDENGDLTSEEAAAEDCIAGMTDKVAALETEENEKLEAYNDAVDTAEFYTSQLATSQQVQLEATIHAIESYNQECGKSLEVPTSYEECLTIDDADFLEWLDGGEEVDPNDPSTKRGYVLNCAKEGVAEAESLKNEWDNKKTTAENELDDVQATCNQAQEDLEALENAKTENEQTIAAKEEIVNQYDLDALQAAQDAAQEADAAAGIKVNEAQSCVNAAENAASEATTAVQNAETALTTATNQKDEMDTIVANGGVTPSNP